MTNVLIPFYSRDGSTEQLALAIAAGAASEGASVRLRRCRETVGDDIMSFVPGWAEMAAAMNTRYAAPSAEDAEWADAIIFGSPTRFGLMASELKAYIDSLGALWFHGKLAGKVGSAFSSTSSLHGGNEVTSLTLHIPMMHFGMILIPPGYTHPAMHRAGTPYGASSASQGSANTPPTQDDLAAAHHQGARTARITHNLRSIPCEQQQG